MKEEKKKVLAARGAADHISSHLSHSYRRKGRKFFVDGHSVSAMMRFYFAGLWLAFFPIA